MSVNLSGKFIPIEYFREYNGTVRPDERNKITPEGEERYAQQFPFRITLDKFGHIYFIPIVYIKQADNGNDNYDIAYTVNDIIEAASGSAVKRKLIDDVHEALKQKYFNHYVMRDDFVNSFWDVARDKFIKDYVATFNKQPNVPLVVTTYTSLSAEQAKELASKALKSTNN